VTANLRILVEIIFNISYLLVIWTIAGLMLRRNGSTAESDRSIFMRLIWMFILLALGDTGHVGFRVIAYLRGGLEANPALVGIGALSTAITVTIFYMILVDIWRIRFDRKLGWFEWSLLAAGFVRLVVMLFPQNQWESLVPPYGWSLLRNAFLVYQGIGVMVLILREARRAGDKSFEWIGWMIALSYLFYSPVILWSAAVPLLGMLMIPKTCAYVVVAVIAYRMMGKSGGSAPKIKLAGSLRSDENVPVG
jgi:hypothetical protein